MVSIDEKICFFIFDVLYRIIVQIRHIYRKFTGYYNRRYKELS